MDAGRSFFGEVVMAIAFACESCGKPCKVGDELAGRTGRCTGCGQMMTIPGTPVAGSRGPGVGSILGRIAMVAIAVPVVLVLLALLLPAIQAARQAARQKQAEIAARGQAQPGQFDAPVALPNFAGPGEGREIAPGVMFHEIALGPAGRGPGQGGKLWLYLPAGEHAAGSLPCILIAPAGTTLLTGNALGDEPVHPERIPYVEAGFAVLAYELDGPLDDEGGKQPTTLEVFTAARKFLAAKAGLVNARVALEYVLAKVPQVDPGRISAAGHSSAGTLAVLFAEHEPRLKSCVAFAPALDLEERFGPGNIAEFRRAGIADLAVRYSPKTSEGQLACPLFLFHARDDSVVPVGGTEAFAARLQALGKPVTLDLVDSGDHFQSMIRQGIPRAIAWLQGSPSPEGVEKPAN